MSASELFSSSTQTDLLEKCLSWQHFIENVTQNLFGQYWCCVTETYNVTIEDIRLLIFMPIG